jgi:hypothetical protein
MTWDLQTEILISGSWVDVTATPVYARDRVIAQRGRGSESSTSADASSLAFTLNNRSGDFSPDNPMGSYYGLIGMNTPVRESVPAQRSRLITPGTGADGATCPDHSRLDITGDIEARVAVWAASWRTEADLIGKWTESGNQRSWRLRINDDGTLTLQWSTNGSAVTSATSDAVVPLPIVGFKVPGFTLDVDNGSGGYTVTFFVASSLDDSSPTQVGSAIETTSGTTSIYSGSSVAHVGYNSAIAYARFYGARIYDGIGGSTAADPDFTTQTDLDTSFADSAGNTWSTQGDAFIDGREWLFHGEIPSWPERWDTSGNDAYVTLTASGPMRRLGKGAKPLRSAYYRGCTSTVAPVTDLVAYWPLEGGPASALANGSAMAVNGTVRWDSDSSSFPCSAPLPDINTGLLNGGVNYVSTGEWQVRMLLAVPEGGTTNGAILMSVRCGGSLARWDIVYGTGGTLQLVIRDSSGADTGLGSVAYSFGVDGEAVRLHMHASQSGGNVYWAFSTLAPGFAVGYAPTGSSAGTVTAVTAVVIGAVSAPGCTVGHVTVQDGVGSVFDLADMLDAHSGETATERVARLCTEEGIAYRILGDVGSADVMMGHQRRDSLLSLLRETEETGAGLLGEGVDFLGLTYRSNRGLVSQQPRVVLDHDGGDLSSFVPVTDDALLINDLTVSRSGGGNYRYEKVTGDLSTQDPPDGAGRYEGPGSVNVPADDLIPRLASWAVNLRTFKGGRLPSVDLELSRSTFDADPDLLAEVTELELGDWIRVTNLTDAFRYDDMIHLVTGIKTNVDHFLRGVTLVTVPAAPYKVLAWDDTGSRLSSAGSTLAAAITTTGQTSISVATPAGLLWGHGSGDFDIVIGGERMTVSAVSGSSSPQTFTVSRAVNGVIKTHASGSAVRLFDEKVWAL